MHGCQESSSRNLPNQPPGCRGARRSRVKRDIEQFPSLVSCPGLRFSDLGSRRAHLKRELLRNERNEKDSHSASPAACVVRSSDPSSRGLHSRAPRSVVVPGHGGRGTPRRTRQIGSISSYSFSSCSASFSSGARSSAGGTRPGPAMRVRCWYRSSPDAGPSWESRSESWTSSARWRSLPTSGSLGTALR